MNRLVIEEDTDEEVELLRLLREVDLLAKLTRAVNEATGQTLPAKAELIRDEVLSSDAARKAALAWVEGTLDDERESFRRIMRRLKAVLSPDQGR